MTDSANPESSLIADATLRIFRECGAPKELEKAPARREKLWNALEASGLTRAWVNDPLGGAGATIADGFDIVRIAGSFAVNVPLVESLLAGWLLSEARIETPPGKLTIAVPMQGGFEFKQDRLVGVAQAVPFAQESMYLVIVVPAGTECAVALVERTQCDVTSGNNLSGDARDLVRVDSAKPLAISPSTRSLEDVLVMCGAARAMQMAGALQAILDLSVAYANERVAFEKPIAKFQVIQHNLARLAAEAAAALAVAGSCADAIHSAQQFDEAVFLEAASAKIRVGEAVAAATGIAHQVHGAIGFSAEHVLHCFTQRLLGWRDDFGAESVWALRLGQRVARNGVDALWPLLAAR